MMLSLLFCFLLQDDSAPDYSRDVRPILSDKCFKCHGPDEKKRSAKLRLDDRAVAIKKGAVVPGKPDQSGVVQRIFSDDAEMVMPPPTSNKTLTAVQKATLRRWIAAGADVAPHWAFVAPKPPPLPPVRNKTWTRTSVDAFILARLESAGLAPQPEADRPSLARRASLDLTGLPPTPEEVDAFVKDPAPEAYEAYVDRLLASPRFGERWARRWLDLARYADTNGYEKDRPRVMWPWRDWVIRAFNVDMPFDRFTIEQLAGDMLPDATPDQKIATGFHRNTMINEEGGIDPLEFRYHSLVDRVNTTSTVWLGMTIGCANCHTHKYDPVTQVDYYRIMAFFDGADEPVFDIPDADVARRRAEQEKKIDDARAALELKFPAEGGLDWTPVRIESVKSAQKATSRVLEDGSVLIGGDSPEKDTTEIAFLADLPNVAAVRLEVLPDESLPHKGPGRAENGNFVVSELSLRDDKAIEIASATADFEQQNFPASAALDGKPETGWAIAGPTPMNVARAAVFMLAAPRPAMKKTWTLKIDQNFGQRHTLGRFRISLGAPSKGGGRESHFNRKLAEWIRAEEGRAVRWEPLRPVDARSNLPILAVQGDRSVFVRGDMTKSDTYELGFEVGGRKVTAIRLEAIADPRLPKGGPGRVHYEGPFGDFWLSEVTVQADGKPVKLARATQSFADGNKTAARAIDGDQQSGWSISGGQGRTHAAVFQLDPPVEKVSRLDLKLLFERYYAAGLGRFRISITGDERSAEARGLSADVEEALLVAAERRTPEQLAAIRRQFLELAPELAGARKEIQKLRDGLPGYSTTLVMQEREPQDRRTTFLRNRGEFLEPREKVAAEMISLFPPLPEGTPRDRLSFARWLVNPQNPLTARVTMNRLWAAFFGRGLVRTTEDFGFQGEAPTHPDLLDWLATDFVRQGWSQKKMMRLIVTSAAYRQSARVTAEALQKDPENKLLSRSPRTRLDAEVVRDSVLKAAGLLSPKIGGPSVFPPQPPGITTEGAYGPLTWTVSQGEDRYRRGLYTFAKRTAPYAMFSTFDGPSGEACVARREVSNTPLQALTMLNDEVVVEAARHAGKSAAADPAPAEKKIAAMFRRCLSREPDAAEVALLLKYLETQKARIAAQEVDAVKIAGKGDGADVERAAWTLLFRALLNLDEFVTRS